MGLSGRIFKSISKIAAGCAVIAFAAALPAYFTRSDSEAIIAAGSGTPTPLQLARLYMDSSKISAACILAECDGDGSKIVPEALKLVVEKGIRGVSGGDEPFFDAYLSTLSKRVLARENRALKLASSGAEAAEFPVVSLYDILSLGENRDKLSHFLKQSQLPIVGKILALKNLNTTALPPSFTSTGAPLESAVLSLALLAQSGDFDDMFLREFSDVIELAPSVPSARAEFEKFAVALLYFERKCDWTIFRSVIQNFPDMDIAYDFARATSAAAKASGVAGERLVAASLLMSGNPRGICNFLGIDENGAERDAKQTASRVEDLTFAYSCGEGALSFLLRNELPVYRPSRFFSKYEDFASPVRKFFARLASENPTGLAWLKLAFAVAGGWLFVRGALGLFGFPACSTRQNAWLSALQGVLTGVLFSIVFLFLVEPSVFEIRFGGQTPPELKFAFAQNITKLGNDIMNIQLDSATMIAVAAFLLLQFVVYIFCIARLAYVKRLKCPADLKFKLLENEDNLFDLNLYVGLTGTVMSLIFLAMNIVSASLMAAYSSTLFGIIFTAVFKIGHLRPFRRKLILESRAEDAALVEKK